MTPLSDHSWKTGDLLSASPLGANTTSTDITSNSLRSKNPLSQTSYFLCRPRNDLLDLDGKEFSRRMRDSLKDAWSVEAPDIHPSDHSAALERSLEDLSDVRVIFAEDEGGADDALIVTVLDRLIDMLKYTQESKISSTTFQDGIESFVKPDPFDAEERLWAEDGTDIFDLVKSLVFLNDQPGVQGAIAKSFFHLHNAYLHSKAADTVLDLIEDDYATVQQVTTEKKWEGDTNPDPVKASEAAIKAERFEELLSESMGDLATLRGKRCVGSFAVDVVSS